MRIELCSPRRRLHIQDPDRQNMRFWRLVFSSGERPPVYLLLKQAHVGMLPARAGKCHKVFNTPLQQGFDRKIALSHVNLKHIHV